VNSGKMMEVSGLSMVEGGLVVQYSGNGGTNQQWAFQAP
jgi:hypothetical protein